MTEHPAWISRLFDSEITGASRLGGGFHNETWRVYLADGRRYAVTRLAEPSADRRAALIAGLQPRLRLAGLAVPRLVDLGARSVSGTVASEYVEGIPGSQLMDQGTGPRQVGAILGAVWRQFGKVDVEGLSLPREWAMTQPLADVSRGRATSVKGRLSVSERALLDAAIDWLPELLRGRPVGFVHGDLCPANLLVQDGELAAILDLEFARVADPLLDAAWLDLIVWHHHQDREPEVWAGFQELAGLDTRDPTTRSLLWVLPLCRLLEGLDGVDAASTAAARDIALLRAALARQPRLA